MDYISLKNPIQTEIEIKKSRFLCYLFPIESTEDFDQELTRIRKEHYKANHHCSAYILNEASNIQKASDDGEPSGTAGVPMLEVLKHHQLTYCAAVVVRYFGGTKLGTGGLIRAYGQAVSQAIETAYHQNSIVKNRSQALIEVGLDYAQYDSFQYFLNQTPLEVSLMDTQYTDTIQCLVSLPLPDSLLFEEELISRFNGQVTFTDKGQECVDVPYHPHTN